MRGSEFNYGEAKNKPPSFSYLSETILGETNNTDDVEYLGSQTSFNKRFNEEDHERNMYKPLKKRQRMMTPVYTTEHAINKKVLPVMPFTLEEEFQVKFKNKYTFNNYNTRW